MKPRCWICCEFPPDQIGNPLLRAKITGWFAVTSCHWQPWVLLSQEPHVIDKHFLLLSDSQMFVVCRSASKRCSLVSSASKTFVALDEKWHVLPSGEGGGHLRDLWQTRFLCYRFDFPLTVQRKCEHIFASVVAGLLCLDVDVPRRIWVDPHPHRAEPMLCFANKKRVRRGVCPWVRAYPWTYPRANLIWLVFTTHLGLPIASLN